MTKRKIILLIVLLIVLVIIGIFLIVKSQRSRIGPDSPFNCKPGFPCVMIEDEGKKKVSDTPEVVALAEKYGGWEHVHIKALDIDLVRHTAFIEKIYPDLADDTGCIIVAHAGNEGYVYREDKELNIAYEETLEEFMERTKKFDSEFMAKFYLSLH